MESSWNVISLLSFFEMELVDDFLIINDSHVVVVLFSFLLVDGPELGLHIKRSFNLFWQLHLSDNDVKELNALSAEHFVQKVFHWSSVGGTLDLVDFQVGFASDQNSDTFCDRGLKLFIQLVHADSVTEVEDRVSVLFAFEHHCDVQSNKDIVVGWARADWKSENDILLCDQKLDLCPGQAKVKTSMGLNILESAMTCDDSVSSFRATSRYIKHEIITYI